MLKVNVEFTDNVKQAIMDNGLPYDMETDTVTVWLRENSEDQMGMYQDWQQQEIVHTTKEIGGR